VLDDIKIVNLSESGNEYKEKAVRLFVDAFYNMYTSISKDKKVLNDFFLSSLDFSLVYIAILDNNVTGFMGIANNKKRTMHFDKIKCVELFGKLKGVIIHKQMKALLEKPNVKNDTDICIDYIATDESYRGKGIASKLIEYACNGLGYKECYLEVLSSNVAAKRLYEHMGFVVYKKVHNPVSLMQGGYIAKMKKQLISQ
jgi:ribosomal protein S18 acetylase RimI-like enzyme